MNNNPLAYTINDACRAYGGGRTDLYKRIAAGEIRAVKLGKRTLIPADSLRAFIASLPAADIRMGGKVA